MTLEQFTKKLIKIYDKRRRQTDIASRKANVDTKHFYFLGKSVIYNEVINDLQYGLIKTR